jgi:hypothetical protein
MEAPVMSDASAEATKPITRFARMQIRANTWPTTVAIAALIPLTNAAVFAVQAGRTDLMTATSARYQALIEYLQSVLNTATSKRRSTAVGEGHAACLPNARLRDEARHVVFTRIEHALRELKSLFLEDWLRWQRPQSPSWVFGPALHHQRSAFELPIRSLALK